MSSGLWIGFMIAMWLGMVIALTWLWRRTVGQLQEARTERDSLVRVNSFLERELAEAQAAIAAAQEVIDRTLSMPFKRDVSRRRQLLENDDEFES